MSFKFSRCKPRVFSVCFTGKSDLCNFFVLQGGGSSGQKHLSEMLSVMESFFYPANVGSWVDRISDFLSELASGFMERVV